MEMHSPSFDNITRVYRDVDTENDKSGRILAATSREHVAPSKPFPQPRNDNNNAGAKKRWESALSKYLTTHSNRRSTEDDSQCTGATSKMTDSTASTNALSHKFARAARSNILSRSKSRGGSNSTKANFSEGDNYQTNNQVEAWMINPKSPVEVINEEVVIENVSPKKAKSQQEQRQEAAAAAKTPQEMDETIINLQNQISMERRGFAVMASKFKVEKDNMTSDIQDLSWKVTLRGKKVNRLEKILADQQIEKAEREKLDAIQAAVQEEERRRVREKELNDENVNTISELLKYELDRVKADHEEVKMNYDELALAFELKRSKLESALNTLEDAIGGLNEFNLLKPMAHGCLIECLDELTEVKDQWRDVVVQNPQGCCIAEEIPPRRNSNLKLLKGAMSAKQQYVSPGSGSDSSTAGMTMDTYEMTMDTSDTMLTGT